MLSKRMSWSSPGPREPPPQWQRWWPMPAFLKEAHPRAGARPSTRRAGNPRKRSFTRVSQVALDAWSNDTPTVRASRTFPYPTRVVAKIQGCRCDLHHVSLHFCCALVANQSQRGFGEDSHCAQDVTPLWQVIRSPPAGLRG
jgi:hypothetical protein